MGLSEIKRRLLVKNAKERKKLEVMLKELEELVNKIKALKRDIESFQKKWGKYLDKQPELISMLSLELLGLKNLERDVEMKIALDILTIGREKNLTLISLMDLIATLREYNPGLPITINEVERALKYLMKEKLIKGELLINGVKYIQLRDFDKDVEEILKSFGDRETITVADVVEELGWDLKRAEKALEVMVELGLAVKEEYPPSYHLVKIT